jgi:hypothetical protein
MTDIKYISPREFVERGYLQEVNRRFLHPLGLALSISIDEDDSNDKGEFVGVWDYREDPEGIVFGGPDSYGLDITKADAVDNDLRTHEDARIKMFGQVIQPLDSALDKR